MSAKRSFDCPHGLDMRLHLRCYLCTPIPETPSPVPPVPAWSCPSWYGNMTFDARRAFVRPSCPVHNPAGWWTYTNSAATATTSAVCVCPENVWLSSCPVHSQTWGKP